MEETNQDREKDLRVIGQKIDRLWMEARHATGPARAKIQNEMRPLREKQRLDRETFEALKAAETLKKTPKSRAAIPKHR